MVSMKSVNFLVQRRGSFHAYYTTGIKGWGEEISQAKQCSSSSHTAKTRNFCFVFRKMIRVQHRF